LNDDRRETFAYHGGGSGDAEAAEKIASVEIDVLRSHVRVC